MWEEGFRNRLRIRDRSQHARCATCMKHREIIRKLKDNKDARVAQCAQWSKHMDRQFADRRVYYDHRAMSRLGEDLSGQKTLSIILDSMDHSKWAIPRSSVLSSKTFGNMARPNLDCTGCIVHGHYVCIGFAENHIVKGSDWTIELLTHVLNKLSQTLDLTQYRLYIQADNCSREAKNNTVCRYLAALCARGRIHSARMHFCASGHSHEDIDQFFSLLGTFLQSQSELHDPGQFLDAVRKYLSNRSVRPLELGRDVVKIDQIRSWTLRLVLG